METYTKFLYDFLGQFFSGAGMALGGIGDGLKQIFNFMGYKEVIDNYKR